MTRFALVALSPLVLLLFAALWQGAWVWLLLGYLSVVVLVADRLVPEITAPAPRGKSGVAAIALTGALGVLHFPALAAGIYLAALAPEVSPAARIAALLATGLYAGQVSNAVAHELIHQPTVWARQLGRWVYISLLFGHHASAHLLVHHRFVATPEDPNTALKGESIYHFLPRAWAGSFRAGYRAEAARNPARARALFALYIAGGIACAVLAFLLAGPVGAAAYLAIALYATVQLLATDYVQHYGLRRARVVAGRYAPFGAAHAWNSGRYFSSSLLLNAPRHSEHHAHPSRPYTALALPPADIAPRLPHGLPQMVALAFLPSLWRRVMHPLLPRGGPDEKMAGGPSVALTE